MLAGRLDGTPFVTWDDFVRTHFDLRPGEHIGVIGPTGAGKTVLVVNGLLPLTPYNTVFGFKPRDWVLEQLLKRNTVGGGTYRRLSRWTSRDADLMPRRVLWPDMTKLTSPADNRHVFAHALNAIYEEGGWTLYLDDLWFMAHSLGLEHEIKVYLTMFRSLGGNLIVATQRPSWIPLEVFDQSTHLFFFRDNDERNLKRISGVGFIAAKLIRDLVANLQAHETLYVNTRTGYMVRTRAPGFSAREK